GGPLSAPGARRPCPSFDRGGSQDQVLTPPLTHAASLGHADHEQHHLAPPHHRAGPLRQHVAQRSAPAARAGAERDREPPARGNVPRAVPQLLGAEPGDDGAGARAAAASRGRSAGRLLCAVPSEAPFWAMKLLSRGRPWAFVFELFPEARFVLVTRSPTTAVPSMMEFVGRDYGVWQRVETAESEFVTAHREALAVRDLGKPYLCVRQEDIARGPRRVWEAVCAFGGFAAEPIEGLHREVNAARSMRGRVRQGRPPLSWAALSPEVVAVSQDLGYLPRAPERDGVKAVVNAALASQLEDAERSRAVLARTCDELRAQLDRLHGTIGGILEPLRSLRVRGDRLTLDEVRRVLEPVAETVDAYLGLVRERDRRERVPAADGDPPRLEFRTTLPCQP